MNNDEDFTSFSCAKCHTEIEASLDMIGQETECPACGAKIVVPDSRADDDGIVRHASGENAKSQDSAIKSRTIRIELGDL
ncbi:MAG: hypothetical protein K6F50_05860 [Kiritimatiellae bacterium]|nr:hypothetical protein [Kiritimatiellia bacterium]